jgi:hypothetical protein
MAGALNSRTAARVYLAIGITGAVVLVWAVISIILSPGDVGSYFTAISGICLIFVGFGGRRAVRRPPE